jgi:hypothetical protein
VRQVRVGDDRAVGGVILAVVGAVVVLVLVSVFDASSRPPRTSTWQRLGGALLVLGVVSAALAQVSAPLGIGLGSLGTLTVGAQAGRPSAAVLAPTFYAGAVLEFAVSVHEDINISFWYVVMLGAPLTIAITAGLLAIAAAIRALRRAP